MATATSLTLRAILSSALAKSRINQTARALSGLTPAAKALAVAATSHRAADAVVLFVLPGDSDLESATIDVRFFLSALEGLSESAAERTVLPFPSHQIDPYRGLAPHFRISYATSTEALRDACKRIQKACAALR